MAEYYEYEAIKRELNAQYATQHIDKGTVLDILANLKPTADVRPVVRGKWIPCGGGKRTCSECNHFAFRVVCNFCPNCGADMREVDDAGA